MGQFSLNTNRLAIGIITYIMSFDDGVVTTTVSIVRHGQNDILGNERSAAVDSR